jgi:hypothetical protein
MPYLFCKEHGQEHETRCREEQENYRRFGETVLAVKGTLVTGPWACDSCNVTLRRGKRAYLMTAFPRYVAETMDTYEFANEKQYFDMKRAEVTLYGADKA